MGIARTKRGVLPLAAVSALTLALSACGGSGSNEGEGGGEAAADCSAYASYGTFDGAEVSVYSTITDLEAERLEDSWVDFEGCTGIDVVYEGSNEFETQIGVRAQAGNPPDIAIIPQPGLLAQHARAGYLKPAPAEVEALVDENWSEDWKSYGTVDGTFYAAPMLASVKGYIWYVPSTFEEKGWEVPQTWDEMMTLTQTIADEGTMKPWCAGFEAGEATGWPGTDWIEDAVLRQAGPEVYDQWINHEIPFNDPQIAEAFDAVGAIVKNEDYVNGGFGDVRSILSTTVEEGGQPVLDGSCAMHHQATFQAANWPEGTNVAEDGDVWAFITPGEEAGAGAITGGGEFVAAYADRDEVKAFQQYMASADFANNRVEQGAAISANKGLDPALAQNPLDRQSIELLQDENTVFRFDASDLMPGAVGANSFWSGIVEWINGASTEQVLDSIESSWPKE
ncbi:alpha-glucosides-binding extracellular protein AglE [Arthrobacter crystallopoietes BAB-32]|uniref:Alpha-glucosides-binding extracellular protein AglE n=1 Tax=Arthrobacter crystallopoietes BAB-32 TaxID=1246476 RepID=N1UTH2_9MICC|nr:ABC transporter substrate-binding protein [Arthrobacter crystallopoietes]EMY33716.1 alpha-glucosides-binding extracellular protein AglE [Arthrobacter crystallopoietes BAB-32]